MEQLAGILPLILIFVVFYFLLIRPQQKKLKDHKNMIANLKKGDRVVTQVGIIGNINYVNADGTLSVEIADNVQVKVAKGILKNYAQKYDNFETLEINSEDLSDLPNIFLNYKFDKKIIIFIDDLSFEQNDRRYIQFKSFQKIYLILTQIIG